LQAKDQDRQIQYGKDGLLLCLAFSHEIRDRANGRREPLPVALGGAYDKISMAMHWPFLPASVDMYYLSGGGFVARQRSQLNRTTRCYSDANA
jgi:hypothetical protein